jgi:DNA invertase Pin-like site-specific DNA recombinase
MTDLSKVKPSHTQRAAYVYIRQSTPGQVEHNRESTARQYALADKACQLGWSKEQVVVIDQDLGLSGSSADKRFGFTRLTSEVALAHVGIVLGLEVSRLARNNADWYRLLELCGVTDTLIGDNDGVYHPALFNDRLLLGLKGTMSEAELHIIRARLDGGIRNKAARGELRRGLPVGLVWGEQDGEVLFHPDEAVTGAIRAVFERFAEFGSARRVWLWFRSEGLSFPLQTTPAGMPGPIRWVAPTYTALHHILTNPVYAGAYTYGKTRYERYVDEHGAVRKRIRHLPMDQWAVLLPGHHPGFIDWATFQANQARLDSNTRPKPHQSGGAVREGSALLQGGNLLFQHPAPDGGFAQGPRHLRALWPPSACSLPRPQLGSGLSLRRQRPRRRTRRVLSQRRRNGHRASCGSRFSRGHYACRDRSRAAVSRTTRIEPRRGFVAMAFGSGARSLRSGAGRAPVPQRGARKSVGCTRAGGRVGEASARPHRRRSGATTPRATAA